MVGGGLDARRRERVIGALGISLLVALVACVASGVWVKWAYRPTEAQAWTDIKTLHTAVTWGLFARNVHRWSAVVVVIGMFAYLGVCGLGFELLATARRRVVWAVAVGAMVVSAVVIPPIGALWERPTSLRWWFLVHEVAGYVRLASVAFAVVVWATRGRAVGPHEQS